MSKIVITYLVIGILIGGVVSSAMDRLTTPIVYQGVY